MTCPTDVAAVYITDDAGRVLIVELVKRPVWSLPGGKGEPGESPRACAAREALEELGVAPEMGGLVAVHHVSPDAARAWYGYSAAYTCFVFAAELTPEQRDNFRLPPGEIAAHDWLDIEDAVLLMDPWNANILRAVAYSGGSVTYAEDGEVKSA